MGGSSSIISGGNHIVDVDAKCWMLSNQLMYPEESILTSKTDVGIALSGGGMRAATLSIGWLQVFHELGVLSKVKCVSSISGGSWTSAPMSSMPHLDVSKFLGSSLPPENCTLQRLEMESLKDGTHAKVLSDSTFITKMIEYFVENIFERAIESQSHTIDFWSEAVGNSFFKPHGIDCSGSLQALQHQKSSADIPYPIINGSILVGNCRITVINKQ